MLRIVWTSVRILPKLVADLHVELSGAARACSACPAWTDAITTNSLHANGRSDKNWLSYVSHFESDYVSVSFSLEDDQCHQIIATGFIIPIASVLSKHLSYSHYRDLQKIKLVKGLRHEQPVSSRPATRQQVFPANIS
jgi:hypothetical protein